MEELKQLLKGKLDLISIAYADQREMIGLIREHVAFTNVFTAEEIRVINLFDRSLPEKIEIIQNLKESDFIESISSYEEYEQARERIQQLENEQALINPSLEVMKARLPKYKISPSHWIMMPWEVIVYLVSGVWHGIVMTKLRIEGRILKYQGERMDVKIVSLKRRMAQSGESITKK